MELFRIGNDVSCLQVRGEVVPGCQREHAHRVAQWVQGRGVRQVVVLASVTSREQSRPDSVTGSRSLRFWCQGDEALRAACEGAGCSELDQATASDRPEAERRTQPWPLIRRDAAQAVAAEHVCGTCDGYASRQHLSLQRAVGGGDTGGCLVQDRERRGGQP